MPKALTTLLFLFSLVAIYAQNPEIKIIKAEDIPIDTTNVIVPSQNPLSDPEVEPAQSIVVDTISASSPQYIHVKSSPEINEIKIPIINLQDDPYLAGIDKKWMELVARSETYETEDYYPDNSYTSTSSGEISTEVLKARLAALNAKTPFNVEYNPILEDLIKRFLKSRSKVVSGLMAKSRYYFPMFEEKLDQYDVPLEMKYLAIVESALQPKARSRAGATGLWQFMYHTGKQYGLEVNSYVDERMDPIFSSDAAARHLADLYDMFNDWDLALAAYNSGAGNVNKAIRRSGGQKNYWNIRPYLPRETASYVPIFYATLYMFEYGDDHMIFPDESMALHHYQTDSIQIKHTITFNQIQEATGVDSGLLEFLNPSYKLNIIPKVAEKDYYLVLPREYIGKFVQNEDLIYAYVIAENAKSEKPLPENVKVNPDVITYRVKSGDYLGKIARKYGVSVKSIMRWNNLRSTRLSVGQRLKIYSHKAVASSTVKSGSKSTSGGKTTTYYTVKSGDTLWEIAQKFSNVSVNDLKKWNNLSSNRLKVGTKLKIIKS